MRLARLAVLGLAVGVIAGFAIALLRTRPLVVTDASPPHASPDPRPTDSTRAAAARTRPDPARPDPAGRDPARADADAGKDDDATVLDVRTHRRVTG